VRAVRGGLGYTKAGANYAASLKSQAAAQKLGYSQVLWLDAIEQKYVEEVGAMNVFFVIDGKVITPALEGTVLPGVTRMSSIELLQSWGITVEQRRLSIEEVMAAGRSGALTEAFGTGTAAVICPVGELNYKGEIAKLSGGKIGELTQRLYDTLTGIQYGAVEDKFGWRYDVK
jgi:branched-chain amino acid aminotransferase